MLSILVFDASSVTATISYVTNLFGDMMPVVILVVGLPLGFWVIRKVISLVRAR